MWRVGTACAKRDFQVTSREAPSNERPIPGHTESRRVNITTSHREKESEMTQELDTTNFLAQSVSPISGTINCRTAAPAIGADAGSSIFIALTNTNPSGSVRYAIYNQLTGQAVDQGTLGKGNSKSVIIPAGNTPQVVRIQNQSSCDTNNITPVLSYAAVVQGG